MATTTGQRIGIWIIAIAMAVGTVAGFVAMMLAPRNQAQQQAQFDKLSSEYQVEYEAYQEKVDALDAVVAGELSDKYYDTFKQYEAQVGSFEADEVTELKTRDLVVGTGEDLTEESTFSAYYIGWNPKGKIFDSSIKGDSLGLPISAGPGTVIEGWTKGVDGMKVGGVRELTIPSDLAYGEAGQGGDIPPNTPLKFIMMVVPTPDRSEAEALTPPDMSDELRSLYQKMYGIDF